MLENIFTKVLNMSITASIAAVLITFFRWIFGRRLPRIFSYTLWAIVFLRLFIPFSIPSMFSVFNLIPTPQTSMTQSQHYYETKGIILYSMNDGNTSVEITAADALSNNINSSLPLPVPEASAEPLQVLTFALSWIWLVGMAGLLLFSLFAYFHTRNKLKTAVLYKCGSLISQCSQKIKLKRKIKIFTSDWVQTPIVCGLIQPRIILPVVFERDLSESEIALIITHELVHIKRFDYLIKPLSVLALCIHWFNPIIWMSFILSQKDMEMSCDEKVISVFGHDIRSEYATSLIRLAVKQNRILNCGLLAFGESNIKSRIKGIMNFKKPGFWLGAVAIAFIIALGTMLLTNGQFDDPMKRNGKNVKSFLTVPAKQPTGIPTEPKNEFDDKNNNTYPAFNGWTPIYTKIIKNNSAKEFSDEVFINSIEGWKATYSPGATHQQEMILYKTTDGGENWSEIANSNDSLPLETKTGITFLNSEIGWISTVTPQEGYIGLYKTIDGGAIWEYQNLNIPHDYRGCLFKTLPPVFFSQEDGVLLTIQSDLEEQLVFVTHDGGNKWVATDENTNNENIKWSFSIVGNGSLWEIIYKNTTWKSNNGYTWSQSE